MLNEREQAVDPWEIAKQEADMEREKSSPEGLAEAMQINGDGASNIYI